VRVTLRFKSLTSAFCFELCGDYGVDEGNVIHKQSWPELSLSLFKRQLKTHLFQH